MLKSNEVKFYVDELFNLKSSPKISSFAGNVLSSIIALVYCFNLEFTVQVEEK
jgi:hypothetical protein